jgi:GAF domain-containing protein
MTARLRDFVSTLEERVAVRTADLEQRSAQLQAAADVGRAATSILDVDELVRRVVDLIRGRFDLYYVGLFLVDDTRKWAVLQAGTGEAGDQMLARGHRLEVGEASMIGWSVSHAQARIAQLAEEDAVRLATPELPETRAEAALPLRSRGEVLGAFTVQSDRRDAFDEATIAVLQTMADQVAVALDNARLFAEAQAVLEAERRAYGDVSREAWQELLQRRSKWGYRYANQVIVPLETPSQPEMAKSTRRNESEQREKNGSEMHMPLKVRDQTVGVLRFQKEGEDKTWTAEEKKLLGVLTEELGQALESARLYEDTQRRAARERLTSHITARMRETLDMETVVQTALREIGENLGIAEIKLRMADREEF